MLINVIFSISEIYLLTVLVNFEITFPLKNDQAAAPTVLFSRAKQTVVGHYSL